MTSSIHSFISGMSSLFSNHRTTNGFINVSTTHTAKNSAATTGTAASSSTTDTITLSAAAQKALANKTDPTLIAGTDSDAADTATTASGATQTAATQQTSTTQADADGPDTTATTSTNKTTSNTKATNTQKTATSGTTSGIGKTTTVTPTTTTQQASYNKALLAQAKLKSKLASGLYGNSQSNSNWFKSNSGLSGLSSITKNSWTSTKNHKF